jgi:hypothetical protein
MKKIFLLPLLLCGLSVLSQKESVKTLNPVKSSVTYTVINKDPMDTSHLTCSYKVTCIYTYKNPLVSGNQTATLTYTIAPGATQNFTFSLSSVYTFVSVQFNASDAYFSQNNLPVSGSAAIYQGNCYSSTLAETFYLKTVWAPANSNNTYYIYPITTNGKTKIYTNETGVENYNTENNEISVYPNPASQSVNIKLATDKDNNYSISIFNIMGKQVYTSNGNYAEGSHEISVDVKDLSNGIYFVVAGNGENRTSQKLIIAH